jgi:hypothetical protein
MMMWHSWWLALLLPILLANPTEIDHAKTPSASLKRIFSKAKSTDVAPGTDLTSWLRLIRPSKLKNKHPHLQYLVYYRKLIGNHPTPERLLQALTANKFTLQVALDDPRTYSVFPEALFLLLERGSPMLAIKTILQHPKLIKWSDDDQGIMDMAALERFSVQAFRNPEPKYWPPQSPEKLEINYRYVYALKSKMGPVAGILIYKFYYDQVLPKLLKSNHQVRRTNLVNVFLRWLLWNGFHKPLRELFQSWSILNLLDKETTRLAFHVSSSMGYPVVLSNLLKNYKFYTPEAFQDALYQSAFDKTTASFSLLISQSWNMRSISVRNLVSMATDWARMAPVEHFQALINHKDALDWFPRGVFDPCLTVFTSEEKFDHLGYFLDHYKDLKIHSDAMIVALPQKLVFRGAQFNARLVSVFLARPQFLSQVDSLVLDHLLLISVSYKMWSAIDELLWGAQTRDKFSYPFLESTIRMLSCSHSPSRLRRFLEHQSYVMDISSEQLGRAFYLACARSTEEVIQVYFQVPGVIDRIERHFIKKSLYKVADRGMLAISKIFTTHKVTKPMLDANNIIKAADYMYHQDHEGAKELRAYAATLPPFPRTWKGIEKAFASDFRHPFEPRVPRA